MVARINTVAFHGVDVQVQISGGLPDTAVGESKERVRGALHALGLSLPSKHLTVNLAPAEVAKEGSHNLAGVPNYYCHNYKSCASLLHI